MLNINICDIPFIVGDKFNLLKRSCKKIELIKGKTKNEKRLQKYIDKYLLLVDEVSLYLIKISNINSDFEKAIINELKRRIDCNKRNTTNNRSTKVLEEMLFRVKNNKQFE